MAGTGAAGYSGDGETATAAELEYPRGIAIDGSGDLFIADNGNQRIREVYASNGTIATVAGTGTAGYSGDGGAATAADCIPPRTLALDPAGNLYIADSRQQPHSRGELRQRRDHDRRRRHRRRRRPRPPPRPWRPLTATPWIRAETSSSPTPATTASARSTTPPALITTVAGTGVAGYSGDNGQATAAMLNGPRGVALDAAGDLYIADSEQQPRPRGQPFHGPDHHRRRQRNCGLQRRRRPGHRREISNCPTRWPWTAAGDLFIADDGNQRIREVNLSTGVITTVAGGGTAATTATAGHHGRLELSPRRHGRGLRGQPLHRRYQRQPRPRSQPVHRRHHHRGRQRDRGLTAATTAGHRRRTREPRTASPWTPAGDLFIADTGNSGSARSTCATGVITTVAGNGTGGFSGDSGQATAAELDYPRAWPLDGRGRPLHRRHRQQPHPRGQSRHRRHHHRAPATARRATAATAARPPPPTLRCPDGHRRGFGRRPLHRRHATTTASARSMLPRA